MGPGNVVLIDPHLSLGHPHQPAHDLLVLHAKQVQQNSFDEFKSLFVTIFSVEFRCIK